MALSPSRVRVQGKPQESLQTSSFDFQLIVREGTGLSLLKKESGRDATRRLVDFELSRVAQIVAKNDCKTFEKLSDAQVVEEVLADAPDPFVLALAMHKLSMKTEALAQELPGIDVNTKVLQIAESTLQALVRDHADEFMRTIKGFEHHILWNFFTNYLPDCLQQIDQYFEMEQEQRRNAQGERSSILIEYAQSRNLLHMSNILKEAIQKSMLSDFDNLVSFLEIISSFKAQLMSIGGLNPGEEAASADDYLLQTKVQQMTAVYKALKAPIIKNNQMVV
jgi:hypothetical protein